VSQEDGPPELDVLACHACGMGRWPVVSPIVPVARIWEPSSMPGMLRRPVKIKVRPPVLSNTPRIHRVAAVDRIR
jgi:hypothetical protein